MTTRITRRTDLSLRDQVVDYGFRSTDISHEACLFSEFLSPIIADCLWYIFFSGSMVLIYSCMKETNVLLVESVTERFEFI